MSWHAVVRLMSSEEQVKNLLRKADPLNTVNVLKKKYENPYFECHIQDVVVRNVKAMKNTNN